MLCQRFVPKNYYQKKIIANSRTSKSLKIMILRQHRFASLYILACVVVYLH